MKKLAVPLIGLIPLILGYLINYLIWISTAPLYIIGIAVWIIWFFAGMYTVRFIAARVWSVLLLNAPAFIALLLLLFQEIVLKRYWSNLIGGITQLFYAPLLYLGFMITQMFEQAYIAYIGAFLCLLIISYIGRIAGERRKH